MYLIHSFLTNVINYQIIHGLVELVEMVEMVGQGYVNPTNSQFNKFNQFNQPTTIYEKPYIFFR